MSAGLAPALLGAIALGCAAQAAKTGASGAPAADAACWPVVALRLDALEHGREWEPVSALNPDGTITNRRGAIGRIQDDTVEIGAEGGALLQGRCAARQMELTSPLAPRLKMRASYGPRDEFLESGGLGARIWVRDDGVVEADLRGRPLFGAPGGNGGVVRVVGDLRRARRTAELLVFTSVASGAGR